MARFRRLLWRSVALVGGTAALLLLALFWKASALAHLRAPEPSVLLRDRHGRFLGEIAAQENGLGFWPSDVDGKLPARVVQATLALEDRRFYRHPGVDPVAAFRALWQNVRKGRRISGASTLAMQVARMQSPGARTLKNKLIEAATALLLTERYGRDAVLAHYLRIVPYGNRLHGIAYAARRYFGKPVDDLSWAEISFLAAIPQAPGRMNPFVPAGKWAATARGKRILQALFEEGVLSHEELDLAMVQIENLKIPWRENRPLYALHAVLRLEEEIRDARQGPAFAKASARRPIVDTTLDLGLQEDVSWRTFNAVSTWEAEGVGNAAVILLDRETSEVLAWVGSTKYFDPDHAGAIDYTRVPRSSGSTLKPLLFAWALERGVITPVSVLDDLDRGAGGITNFDERFLGPLLPRVALANSRNVPAADLLGHMGIDEGYGFFRDLGLARDARPARYYGLGMAIGGLPVTLEELVRAYGVLAREGLLVDPVWYRGQPREEPHRVLSESTARLVSLFLSDPMARLPTFPRRGATEYPFPVAVKTGTSSQYHDAWTVAYSKRYLLGVWMGHPSHRPMSRLSGYRSAARLAQEILEHLHRDEIDGLEDAPFPPPRGYQAVKLCALTGQLASPACPRAALEWVAPGQEPVQECSAHVRVAVDVRSGELADPLTPRAFVEVRTFTDLPPRYAAWMNAEGLPRPPHPSEPDSTIDRDRLATLHITSPENGMRVLNDPETPAALATLALKVTVEPAVEQVMWVVDGEPFQVVDHPYVARWPIQPGEHTFEARLVRSEGRSRSVRVRVQ